MAELTVTFLDVGWGDSILLECVDDQGGHHFGLVDSNDTSSWPTSRVYLKRHFERYAAALPRAGCDAPARTYPFFDFVVASHAHADHVAGLQAVLRHFGTRELLSPRFDRANSAALSRLIAWARRATSRTRPVATLHRYLDRDSAIGFGPVNVTVLWPRPPLPGMHPPDEPNDLRNENNNSVVLQLELGSVRMVLTGDCQAENWTRNPDNSWPIALPTAGLKLVQIPHHGARNGLFDRAGGTPLIDQIAELAANEKTVDPVLAVSCHPVPHKHPHPEVAAALDRLGDKPAKFGSWAGTTRWLRTDRNLHFSVWTDGTKVETRARPAV